MIDRDWDKDFDLAAWQAMDARSRQVWIHNSWIRERDDEDATDVRRRRYERGQTAWDVGLEPQPFDVTPSEAIDVVKPEHWDGRIFGDRDERHRVLSALMANAGVRRTIRLAPREVWEEAIRARAASVAYQRAAAADRAAGTQTARYEDLPEPTPVMRPEFVALPEPDSRRSWWSARMQFSEPFERWDRDRRGADIQAMRTIQAIGYLTIGDRTLTRTDILVLREPWRAHRWPTESDAALVVYTPGDEGAVLFDWHSGSVDPRYGAAMHPAAWQRRSTGRGALLRAWADHHMA
jgi:hypothetical protein